MYITGYVFPIVYFVIRLGIIKTETSTNIVVPVLVTSVIAILKLAMDIPRWVATWKPSFMKGLIKAIPKLLIFIFLMTLGFALQYAVKRAIDIAFTSYFETVLVVFGGQALGSIFGAFYLKYKELYLISIGYVLGTVNK